MAPKAPPALLAGGALPSYRREGMIVTDPVCGAVIDAEDAVASQDYQGQTYFFCSDDCLEQFEVAPQDHVLVRED